jgi:hypothetical protein
VKNDIPVPQSRDELSLSVCGYASLMLVTTPFNALYVCPVSHYTW